MVTGQTSSQARQVVHAQSVSSEITFQVQDQAFDSLDAPIKRITTADTPAPFSPVLLEEWLPNANDVIKAVKEVMYVK